MISAVLYIVGVIGDSYSSYFELFSVFHNVIAGYRDIFLTTRNGLFYGLLFYSLGYYLPHIENLIGIEHKSFYSKIGMIFGVGCIITCLENLVFSSLALVTR